MDRHALNPSRENCAQARKNLTGAGRLHLFRNGGSLTFPVMTRVRVICGQSDGSFSPIETAGRPDERGMRAMTRPPTTPHLGVALVIAHVCLAYTGVARAQVFVEPVSEPQPA